MLDTEAFLAAALEDAERAMTSCASCGSDKISEVMARQDVPFGGKGETFSVQVPIMKCEACEYSFTDHRAEKIRKDGIYDHLGLLRPAEVKGIRLALGMTRKDFDAAYGLPSASMERWENGRIIQNKSMDTLLRALSNPVTAHRLDRRQDPVDGGSVVQGRFSALEAKPNGLSDARSRAQSFHLRAVG